MKKEALFDRVGLKGGAKVDILSFEKINDDVIVNYGIHVTSTAYDDIDDSIQVNTEYVEKNDYIQVFFKPNEIDNLLKFSKLVPKFTVDKYLEFLEVPYEDLKHKYRGSVTGRKFGI